MTTLSNAEFETANDEDGREKIRKLSDIRNDELRKTTEKRLRGVTDKKRIKQILKDAENDINMWAAMNAIGLQG
ncbi:MAG: hypothetical protein PHX30_00110 [Candidatus Pacebacteria bacterium]|nr:hypothetical protein [Candidatus Paceibacterota bacterium]